MRNIISALLLCVISVSALSMDWLWQNPLPGNAQILTVRVLDDSNAVLSGDRGYIARTSDRGEHWQNIGCDTFVDLAYSVFETSQKGWLYGGSYSLLTNDGGKTWSLFFGNVPPSYGHIRPNGIGYGPITKDNGLTWIIIPWITGSDNIASWWKLDSLNTIISCYGGPQNALRLTHDNGATFSDYFKIHFANAADSAFGLGDCAYADSQVYISGGTINTDTMQVWRSIDKGVSWYKLVAYLSRGGYCDKFHFTDSLSGVTISDSIIGVTRDGGRSWHQAVARQDTCKFIDIDLADNGAWGLVVGSNGTVYRSVDSCKTWGYASKGPRTEFRCLGVPDSSTCVAGGVSDKLYRTEDCGNTWQFVKVTQDTAAIVESIDFSDSVTGWATGISVSGGAIWHTTDKGKTWSASLSASRCHFLCVKAVSPSCIYASGYGGLLLKTVNGGSKWDTIVTPVIDTQLIWCVNFCDSLTGLIGASSGICYRTADGGKTWTQVVAAKNGSGILCIKCLDKSTWVIGTSSSYIYRSTDSAKTFEEKSYAPTLSPSWDLYPVTQDTVLMVSEGGICAISLIGTGSPPDRSLNKRGTQPGYLFQTRMQHDVGWCVGSDGVIVRVRLHRSTVVPIQSQAGKFLPGSKGLIIRVNNRNLRLNWNQERSGKCIVTVYDLKGRSISRKEITAHSGEQSFSESLNTAAGMYLLKLESGFKTESRCFVLE